MSCKLKRGIWWCGYSGYQHPSPLSTFQTAPRTNLVGDLGHRRILALQARLDAVATSRVVLLALHFRVRQIGPSTQRQGGGSWSLVP